MQRDKLIIYKSKVENNEFYCWTCEMLNMLLIHFPELNQKIDVERVPFQAGQSLPILVLADNAPQGIETDEYQGARFVKGMDKIMDVLRRRHGVPVFRS